MTIIDAHNHIESQTNVESILCSYSMESIKRINESNFSHYSLGVLPWLERGEIDFNLIEKAILSNPSINIGEIGLDRRYNDLQYQVSVVIRFLDMAKKYYRGVSFHCVKRWGMVIELLNKTEYSGIPIMFHSFTASLEVLDCLIDMNSYFSLNIRNIRDDRTIPLIKAVPIGQLLIESDISDNDYNVMGHDTYLDQLFEAYRRISEIKDIPINLLSKRVLSNFNQFLRREV